MRALLVVALFPMGGCWHDAPPPQTPTEPPPAETEAPYFSHARPGLECSAVIQSVLEKYDQTNSGISTLHPVLLEVGITSCQEDSWSDELLECFHDANDDKDIQACAERLSKEQQERFNERLRIAIQSSGWPGSGGSTP